MSVLCAVIFRADGAMSASMMLAGAAVGGLAVVCRALPTAELHLEPTGSFWPLVVRALMLSRER